MEGLELGLHGILALKLVELAHKTEADFATLLFQWLGVTTAQVLLGLKLKIATPMFAVRIYSHGV